MSIQDNFRLAMRRYIYSVSILSNKDEEGNSNAITVSSVTSISMEPPSLLVCINKNSRIHDTLKEGSKFCINLLSKDQEELSNICSDENKYDERFNDTFITGLVEEIIESPWINHFAVSPRILKSPLGDIPSVFLSLVVKQKLKSI